VSVVIAAILPGCSPLYVLRAAYEEGKILWRREPITDFVDKADVQADAQEKLKLVLALRQQSGRDRGRRKRSDYGHNRTK
jgi:hypothetical protein